MKKNERDWNIELLRIITMFMVVFIHAFEYGKIFELVNPNSIQYYVYRFIHALCQVGVNCFVLISGYYLINSKTFIHRFLKIFIHTVFYSLLFYLIFVVLGKYEFEWKMVMVYATPIGHEIYWYVTRYIVLLVFVPFINILIKNLNLKQFKFFILLMLTFFSVYPFLFHSGYLNMITGKEFSLFILLYCIGAYIRKSQIIKPVFSCFCLYTMIILTGVCIIIFADKLQINIENNYILRYNSPLIIGASYFFFMAFKGIKIDKKVSMEISGWIQKIGGLTFGVYLIHNHPIIRQYIYLYISPSYLYFFVYIIGIFMISASIEYIRKKLFFKPDVYIFHFSNYLENKLGNIIG